ncbi:histidine kinase [Cellulosimicrobium arenosum]|uniref:histidine kinase n=1 Tax=Cellulosimicrobium arenosum TaxID=2708133 RepID=A0A927G895_9MICO|nr:two-component sensor histidine kinase [Cellulosimicrobium arenosum]
MTEVLRRWLAAGGIRTATARDAVLAGVVAAASVALVLGIEQLAVSEAGSAFGAGPGAVVVTAPERAAVVAVLVAQSACLVLRRRDPVTCLALTVLGQVALLAVLPAYLSFQAPATLVAAYSVGAYAPRRRGLVAAAVAAVVQALLLFALGGGGLLGTSGAAYAAQASSALVNALLTYLGAALVGEYVATRRSLLAELRDRVRRAERERAALAAQAVLEERGRMARELHDVAAHHLSGIVVQAAAAERLVDRDPERAKESMRRIRSQGRETLDNLRLVVGLLRGPGDTEAAPQPTLADVPGLLADARAAGADVQDQTRGDPCALAPSTQLTVYRVLQEALSNARRHGTGRRVEVLLDYREPGLVLHVRNAAPAAERGPVPGPASHGIVGMTERATMVGGTLTAGPRPDGAWYVRLAVPRSPRAVHHATGGTVLPAAPEEPGVAPSPTTEERP